MRVYERQEFAGGLGGSHFRVRVVELDKMPPKPKDGEPADPVERRRVNKDTPAFDWMLESEAPKVLPDEEPEETTVPPPPPA